MYKRQIWVKTLPMDERLLMTLATTAPGLEMLPPREMPMVPMVMTPASDNNPNRAASGRRSLLEAGRNRHETHPTAKAVMMSSGAARLPSRVFSPSPSAARPRYAAHTRMRALAEYTSRETRKLNHTAKPHAKEYPEMMLRYW